ncbi:unnamed protein product, partial [Pylaiella littoralis]
AHITRTSHTTTSTPHTATSTRRGPEWDKRLWHSSSSSSSRAAHGDGASLVLLCVRGERSTDSGNTHGTFHGVLWCNALPDGPCVRITP